jgi:membrane protease YdiL (CAAX protease family)
MLSVTFSAFVVKEAVTASVGLSRLQGGGAILARAGVLAAYYAVQVAVLVWLVRRRGGDVAMALGLRSAERSTVHALGSVSLVVAGLVATRFVASAYVWLTREIGLMPTSGVDLPGLFGTDAGGLALAVLMVVVVGPAVEEAVFRAALLEGLTARYGIGIALVVQAALFAAFHRSAWLFLPTFVLGVVLGWLAHERESLWPAIGLHALYNAVTVAAAFLVAVGA